MDLRFYILRRVVVIIPTLFLLSFITFIFARPFLPVYGSFSNGYLSFLSLIFHGNLGTISTSIFTGPFIIGFELYFPVTVEIVIMTVILTFVIGVPLGTYIGNSRIKETDFIARIFSLIFYSMPLFWIAIILEFTFGSGIGVFAGLFGNHAGLPVLGQGYSSTTNVPWISDQVSYPTHMLFFDSLLHGDFTLAYISFLHIIIPVIALTLSILAIIIRYIRAGVIDYSSTTYTRNAVARGIGQKRVVMYYSRRNGFFPSATIIGLIIAYLLTGSLLLEYFFGIRGLGFLIVEIIGNIGTNGLAMASLVLVFGIIFMIVNIVVDLVYVILNPEVNF